MIRIAIVDDESLVASSLATLLGLEEDLEVAVTASSGEEILAWFERGQRVDVCVLDLQLGGIDGIDTATQLRGLAPELATLIVTSHARPRGLRRALENGVLGFLPKTSTAEQFAEAVRSVHAGRRYPTWLNLVPSSP